MLAVQVGDFSVQFAPWSEPGPTGKPEPREVHPDPLNDPATYPDGRVPGFTRPDSEEPT